MHRKASEFVLTLFVILFGVLPPPVFAQAGIKRVIYVTLDGVRWQDFYLSADYFYKLWRKRASKLNFYGKPGSGTTMEVASIPISLPSYQSQMAGSVQSCNGNECGQIKVQTLPERLMDALPLTKKQVVMFASWVPMKDSVESRRGAIYANYGNMPVVDPDTQQPDEIMAKLNGRQEREHPPQGDRYDNFTVLQAFHYFKKYKPTFMWISLAASDNAAHADDLNLYRGVLHYYDEILDALFNMLVETGMDAETMVIVTTDHGRSNSDWTAHGPAYPESKQTWAFVYHGELMPVSRDAQGVHYSTLSIRPTVEASLMGKVQ